VANTLAYYDTATIMSVKSFITQAQFAKTFNQLSVPSTCKGYFINKGKGAKLQVEEIGTRLGEV
jgi:hypothetical protein